MLVYEKKTIYLAHKPSRKEKTAIFRALITHKFMRSKNAQCKTEECP